MSRVGEAEVMYLYKEALTILRGNLEAFAGPTRSSNNDYEHRRRHLLEKIRASIRELKENA